MPRYPILNRCTVQRHNGEFCDAPSPEGMPFPICARHAIKLYHHLKVVLADAQADPLYAMHKLNAQIMSERREREKRENTSRHVVYYVRIGELIKIGTTTNLTSRLHQYPPSRELLAVEPGGTRVEHQRIKQFAHLLAYGKEWFRPGPDLLEHIDAIRRITAMAS